MGERFLITECHPLSVDRKEVIMSDSRNDNFLIAVFNKAADHIQFLKKQQWTITYYCLLLYAAIVAVFRAYLPNASCLERGVLFLFAAGLCVIGCILVFVFEKSMKEHRVIIDNIYEAFPEEKKIALAHTVASTDVRLIRIVLVASLIIGFIIVGWSLYRNP
jgi:hypothetical protein